MLYIINGPEEGQIFDLREESTFVGRGPDNDIQIRDDSVSRRHIRIFKRGDEFLIEDLGSENGTWIKGEPIKPGTEALVEKGVPIALGRIFISIEDAPPEKKGMTQYAINLSEHIEKTGRNLLYKDRRITDRKKLETIYEVSILLMQSMDVREICEKAMDALFDCLKRIDSAALLLKDPASGKLQETISRSRNRSEPVKMQYSRTIVNRVLKEGKAIMMSDTSRQDENDLSESIEIMRIKSVMCVPLISKSETLGVIYVHSLNVPNGFRKDDLFLLTGMSGPVALAVENAMLHSGRERAEAALRETEEKYRLMVDHANDAILISQDGVIKSANLCTMNLTGYSETELAGKKLHELCHPEDMELVLGRDEKRQKGEPVPRTYAFRIFNKEGRPLWVQINAVLVSWEGKPATLNFLRDISREKILEDRLIHAQKMEAIGTLAGGIAHDFNNLLMGIQGNASLMLLDTDQSHPHYTKLKNIEIFVSRGSDLTQQLLDFAKPGKVDVKPMDLNDLINGSSEMFGRTRKEIRIFKKFQRDLWAVDGDRRQMEQVMLNLYLNAWQAMPKGGKLFIETQNISCEEKEVRALGIAPGKFVRISLTDTGGGMEEAVRKRIFEPFFTTREIGRGSGLGLATVYGIVKDHGGTITVHSKIGEGTVFQIYIPASRKGVARASAEAERLPGGKETVLLVDDEAMIIDVGRQMLEKMGYRVLFARGGVEALEVFKHNRGEVDLVILDMNMPDMGGTEAFHRLVEVNPEIRVLLSSGYTMNERAKALLDQGCSGFIQKPFRIGELASKIREILEHKPESSASLGLKEPSTSLPMLSETRH